MNRGPGASACSRVLRALALALCAFEAAAEVTYDVRVECDKIEVRNVRDFDGTEDVFGTIEYTSARIDPAVGGPSGPSSSVLFNRGQQAHLSRRSGQVIRVDSQVDIFNDLTLTQLRHVELTVGGALADDEGLGFPRRFTCFNCNGGTSLFGRRTLRFIDMPSTQRSIQRLANSGDFQLLKFGDDTFFELQFFENGKKADGYLKVLFRVKVRPQGRP